MCNLETNKSPEKLPSFNWEEIKKHASYDDKWIVLHNNVYDVSRWCFKHPGGARIISHSAGQDATDAWTAFHDDKEKVKKFMKPLLIGTVEDPIEDEITSDFRKLRQKVENEGLLKVNVFFYIAHFAHIVALEILAYFVIYKFGTGWTPYLISSLIMMTMQAQAGWIQHDYGHLSVFKNNKMNHFMHHIVIGFIKGASSRWWNFRHFQHHSKPNIIKSDPDIDIPYLFLLGKKIPVMWGQRKKGFMPYDKQHNYFFALGPPLLLPTYFHYENVMFVIKRKLWTDLFWMGMFFVKHFYLYGPLMGAWGAFWFYMFFRMLESHWFVWVTQMNHIPMRIDFDEKTDWLTLQCKATCNVDPSFFNDWFTGHLNYQIEHHLFPTMPRHNYNAVKPMVMELCKKHGVKYESKTLWGAFADVVGSLKDSGQLWYKAYYHLD